MEAEVKMGVTSVVLGVVSFVHFVNGQEQCNGELWCERGHCCGSDGTHCCTYYYELWWFWMIWGLIIMLSCCCLYQQHRLKKRQRRALRVLRDGTLVRHDSTPFNSYAETFAESDFRLPTYDEVQDLSKDPPAYEALFEGERQSATAVPSVPDPPNTVTVPETQRPLSPLHIAVDSFPQIISDSDHASLLNNEAVPEDDAPPAYTAMAPSVSIPPPVSPL